MTPEFSRLVDIRQIGPAPLTLAANEGERAALAKRFALVSVARLEATISLSTEGDVVTAQGTFDAAWVQPCAISGEDLPQAVREPVALRFVPESTMPSGEEEVELSESELDEIPYTGTHFDLGEALAQSLALAIDPFAAGPEADRVRATPGLLGEGAAGPFAALAGLKVGKADKPD